MTFRLIFSFTLMSCVFLVVSSKGKNDPNCPEAEGFFPIPGLCTGDYFVCIEGSPYVQTCPGTSIFDPLLLTCVPAEDASCGPGASTTTSSTTPKTTAQRTTTTTPTTTTTSTTTTTPTTTTAGPFVCPPGVAGNYPYPGDCTKYYTCTSTGIQLIQNCPAGTVFNPENSFCDDPENVPGCSVQIRHPGWWIDCTNSGSL